MSFSKRKLTKAEAGNQDSNILFRLCHKLLEKPSVTVQYIHTKN